MVKEVDASGESIHGTRRINDTEAAVVRRIFEDYAAGSSPRTIAEKSDVIGLGSVRIRSCRRRCNDFARTGSGLWERPSPLVKRRAPIPICTP